MRVLLLSRWHSSRNSCPKVSINTRDSSSTGERWTRREARRLIYPGRRFHERKRHSDCWYLFCSPSKVCRGWLQRTNSAERESYLGLQRFGRLGRRGKRISSLFNPRRRSRCAVALGTREGARTFFFSFLSRVFSSFLLPPSFSLSLSLSLSFF